MHCLIAFYSSDTSCKTISLFLKEFLEKQGSKVSLIEIIPQKKLRDFEYQKLNEVQLANKKEDFNVLPYDIVFIGSTTIVYSLSKVTESFIRKLENVNGKSFAFYCSCVLPGNSLKRMEAIISSNAGIVLKSKAFQSVFGFPKTKLKEVEGFAFEVLELFKKKAKV